ncbi:ATP-binding cassette domain-containing protein [Pediococcus parvulus]|nr:ATP-binding cassette domain-containing protein [Pediococcus parvulus]
MTDILTIKNLSYKRNLTNILNQLNCSLPTGSIVGLLGENGAGKTTLMRLISGAANHYRGEIKVSSETSPSDRKQLVSFSHQVDDVNRSDRLEKIAHFYEAVYPDFSTNKFQRLSEFLNLDLS